MTNVAPFDRVYIGARAIGRALGCSADTALRMIADGRLVAFRTGSHTSPWKAFASEIRRARTGIPMQRQVA